MEMIHVCVARSPIAAPALAGNGGAIAIAHPLGASGARIMTALVNALGQRPRRIVPAG